MSFLKDQTHFGKIKKVVKNIGFCAHNEVTRFRLRDTELTP